MPYILVCSVTDQGTRMRFRETTIEGNICLDTLKKVGKRTPHGNYEAKTNRCPSDVLNILEAEGYKVVGTNTITHYRSPNNLADCSNHLIWTLHKQA